MATTLETLIALKNKVKSNLVIISIISIVIAGIVGFFVKQEKEKFNTYSKIFPLSINKAGGGSPLDAIKAQFGVSDKTDFDKIYNITELVKSKRVSHKVVKASTTNKDRKSVV